MSNASIKANDFMNDVKQYFVQKEITVKAVNGKDYPLLVDTGFSKTKLSALITDAVERANYCEMKEVTFDISLCLYSLIIKYFTNIKFIDYKDVGKKYANEIDTLKALIDLEIIEDIIASFDSKSMAKLVEFAKEQATLSSYAYQVQIDQAIEEFEADENIKNEMKNKIDEAVKQTNIDSINNFKESDIKEIVDDANEKL